MIDGQNPGGNSEQNNKGNISDNMGFYGASALQIRLDTTPIIKEIELFLRGFREEWFQDKDGTFKTRMSWQGQPLLNNEGIQSVMSFVIATFNNQVVQGNFVDEDMYGEFLCRARKDLAFHLMLNMYKYEIKPENYGGIISTVMRYVEVFMTRPLFNKERESYAQTLKSTEVMSMQQKSGGGFFKSIF